MKEKEAIIFNIMEPGFELTTSWSRVFSLNHQTRSWCHKQILATLCWNKEVQLDVPSNMTIFSKSGGIIWVYNSFLHIIVLWWNLLMRLAAGSLQLTQLTNLFLKIDAEKVLNIFFSFSLPVPVTKTRGWIRCGENRLKPSSKPQLWHSKEHSFVRPRLKEKIRHACTHYDVIGQIL